MIAKIPVLGFALVTALAGQAVAHEGHGRHDGYGKGHPHHARSDRDYRRGDGPRADAGYRGAYRDDLRELRRSDLNRDGWVTMTEALRFARRDFQRTDRDRNHVLTPREVAGRDIVTDDRNRNGRISFEEHESAVRRAFWRFDANRDGLLASYELTNRSTRPAGWRR